MPHSPAPENNLSTSITSPVLAKHSQSYMTYCVQLLSTGTITKTPNTTLLCKVVVVCMDECSVILSVHMCKAAA